METQFTTILGICLASQARAQLRAALREVVRFAGPIGETLDHQLADRFELQRPEILHGQFAVQE